MVLVLLGDASLLVLRVSGEGYRQLREYQLGKGMAWSHPAFVDGRILVRVGPDLMAYSLSYRR